MCRVLRDLKTNKHWLPVVIKQLKRLLKTDTSSIWVFLMIEVTWRSSVGLVEVIGTEEDVSRQGDNRSPLKVVSPLSAAQGCPHTLKPRPNSITMAYLRNRQTQWYYAVRKAISHNPCPCRHMWDIVRTQTISLTWSKLSICSFVSQVPAHFLLRLHSCVRVTVKLTAFSIKGEDVNAFLSVSKQSIIEQIHYCHWERSRSCSHGKIYHRWMYSLSSKTCMSLLMRMYIFRVKGNKHICTECIWTTCTDLYSWCSSFKFSSDN